MSIQVIDLSKSYGSQKALDSFSVAIDKGEIVGFLGPNGAGKSTLMKLLTGYLKPDAGMVKIDGIDINSNPKKAKTNLGYLPEHNPLYQDMFVKEYLGFHAGLHGVSKRRIDDTIKEVGLEPEKHKKINQLSKGYQQRVGIAAALLHQPKVLILDEPTTGLDPNQLIEIRQLIKTISKDRTVFFSSHIMREVEALCDRVVLLNKGKLVADGSIKDLKQNNQQIVSVNFEGKVPVERLKTLPDLLKFEMVTPEQFRLYFETTEDRRAQVFDFANQEKLRIVNLQLIEQDLESLFVQLTK